jgi:hypothetical protein
LKNRVGGNITGPFPWRRASGYDCGMAEAQKRFPWWLIVCAAVLVPLAAVIAFVERVFLANPHNDRQPGVQARRQERDAALHYYAERERERLWTSILSDARYGVDRASDTRTAAARRHVPLLIRIESHPDYKRILRETGPERTRKELIDRLKEERVLMECLLGNRRSELQGDESQWLAVVRDVLSELTAGES